MESETGQCIVCNSQFEKSFNTNIEQDNISCSDTEFWTTFSSLFHVDLFELSVNICDSWAEHFCQSCKPIGAKLFSLQQQLLSIQGELSATITQVSETILRTENEQQQSHGNQPVYNNGVENIRKAIYTRFTPTILLEKCEVKNSIKASNGSAKRSSRKKQSSVALSNVSEIKEEQILSLPDKIDCDSLSFDPEFDIDFNDFHDSLNGGQSDDDVSIVDVNEGNDDKNDPDFDHTEFILPSEKSEDTKSAVKEPKLRQRKKRIRAKRSKKGAKAANPNLNGDPNSHRSVQIAPGKYLYIEKFEYERNEQGLYCCLFQGKEGRCPSKRKVRTDIHRHINNKHNKESRFNCEVCNRHWNSKVKMDSHNCCPKVYQRPIKIRQLPDGSFTYDNKFVFVKHNDLFRCSTCNESKTSIKAMSVHIISRHAEPTRFVCQFCGSAFGARKTLHTHMAQHTTEREFLCDKCPAAFKTMGHLWAHKHSHKDAPQYPCDVCGKSFKYSHGLRRHRLAAGHLPSADAPPEALVYCPKCEKPYLHQRTLDLHLKNCAGKRTFQCSECKKLFQNNQTLRAHWRWAHRHKEEKSQDSQEPLSTDSKSQDSNNLNTLQVTVMTANDAIRLLE